MDSSGPWGAMMPRSYFRPRVGFAVSGSQSPRSLQTLRPERGPRRSTKSPRRKSAPADPPLAPRARAMGAAPG
jgi:hypothetical protein